VGFLYLSVIFFRFMFLFYVFFRFPLFLVSVRSTKRKGKNQRAAAKSVDWIKAKKEKYRRLGKDVKTDSKYTGRRRPHAF
jgi:hypothetical protein